MGLPERVQETARLRREPHLEEWALGQGIPLYPPPSIHRALIWYRKALLEEDRLDQFMNLWTGLEVINQLITRKYALPAERPVRTCQSCGAQVMVVPTLAGIEYILTSLLNESRETWRRALDIRTQLTHGFGALAEMIGEVQALIPVLRKALLRGVLDLLGVPEAKQSTLIREPLRHVASPYARACVSLRDLPIDDIVSGKTDVGLEIENANVSTEVDAQGKKHERAELTVKLRGHKGPMVKRWIEVIAEKDPEDTEAEISLKAE